jgi:hypothetical protein
VFVPFFLFFTILGLIYLNRIEFASSGDWDVFCQDQLTFLRKLFLPGKKQMWTNFGVIP